jgi:predicted dehydrogenase
MAKGGKSAVNVGVVGLMGYGGVHLQECRGHAGARLLAVCDLNRELAESAARKHGVKQVFTDYREMLALAKLDAVVIATPHFLHYQMIADALAAGKHVLCEKPLAIRPEDADAAVRLARERSLVLSCNYGLRLGRGVRALREVVKSGLVGEVYHARARWLARWTGFMFAKDSAWRTAKAQAGGGILIGRGCHLVDALLFALGHPPVRRVFATCHRRLAGFEVEDLAAMTMVLEGGGSVELEASYVLNEPDCAEETYCVLHGTRGGVSFRSGGAADGQVAGGRLDLATGRWLELDLEPILHEAARPQPKTLLPDFVDSIIEGRQPLVTGEQAALVTRVIAAGYQSAETGRAVEL